MDIQEFLKLINLIASSFASGDIFTWIRHEISSPEDSVYFPLTEKPILLEQIFQLMKKTEFMEMNIHDFHM